MENINMYRLLIVNSKGEIFSYPKITGQMHNDCINDYVKKESLDYSSIMDLLNRGDCLFYNLGNGNFTTLLPSDLTTMQSYTLDNLCNYMDEVNNMVVETIDGREYSLNDSIGDLFSTKVIQSYYDNKKNIK